MARNLFKHISFKIALFLCVIVFQVFVVNAQMKTRTPDDSSYARKTNTWFIPANYQFENQYPKLTSIPPLSSEMSYEIMLGYIYLDSLIRNFDDMTTIDRWFRNHQKNDTLNYAIEYLYKLKDFDPQRFYQYGNTTSAIYYKSNMNFVMASVSHLLSEIMINSHNYDKAFIDLNDAYYILKVHVTSVDSLPWIGYPGKFVYGVRATVTDTIKGKRYTSCCPPQSFENNEKNDEILQTGNNCICFNYYTGHYSNDHFHIDQSLKDQSGNLKLSPGMDLVITLNCTNYKWDYNYDYFNLSLYDVFAIINGNVQDPSQEFSNSTSTNYQTWKNSLLQKVNLLLTGGW